MPTKTNELKNEITLSFNKFQKNVNEIDKTAIPDENKDDYNHLKKIESYLSTLIYNADIDLIPEETINEIKANLTDIERYLNYSENYTKKIYINDIKRCLDKLLKITPIIILKKENEFKKLINTKELQLLINETSEISKEINNIYQEIQSTEKKFKETNLNHLKNIEESNKKTEEIKGFYEEIFGIENESEKNKKGLKQEFKELEDKLKAFETTQKIRYLELNKQIENLLPGATSAGLSSAYNEMRNKFSQKAAWYGIGFYITIILLFIVIYNVRDLSIVREIPLDKGLGISLFVLLGNFAVKLPFIIPALWLVIFVSKRRSEAERLTQEYAHKESLAKSYDSYKQQIEKLSEENKKELMPILMECTIKAIALNPAETLDKKHQSDSPISEILKDKSVIDSIIDNLKNLSPKSK